MMTKNILCVKRRTNTTVVDEKKQKAKDDDLKSFLMPLVIVSLRSWLKEEKNLALFLFFLNLALLDK